MSSVTTDVSKYRAHVDTLSKEMGFTVQWGAVTDPLRASVSKGCYFYSKPEIKAAPIVDDRTYVIVLHEVGHGAGLHDSDTHRRVNIGGHGLLSKFVCPRCELLAWRWAAEHAIEYTPGMHATAAECLRSYREYAEPADKREIDEFIGPRGFSVARLFRWTADYRRR